MRNLVLSHLYLMILLFSSHFLANTHLYPRSFITSIIRTISPKTYRLAFFHIWWLRIFILSYDTYGHLKNKNIVNNNNILISCIHKFLRSHNSHAHVTPCELLIQYVSLHRLLFNTCLYMISCSISTFLWALYLICASFTMISFHCVLLLQRVISF